MIMIMESQLWILHRSGTDDARLFVAAAGPSSFLSLSFLFFPVLDPVRVSLH
jgi:hypothetical protein